MAYTMNTTWQSERSRSEIRRQLERWDWDVPGVVDLDTIDFPKGGREDTAGRVHFNLRGTTIKVECESQWTYKQNIRCVALAVETMRMNEKRGIADTMRKAYLMIEAPKEQRDPYEVLGVRPDASEALLQAAYKAQANDRHPDKGGSDTAMQELNDARERIRVEREG